MKHLEDKFSLSIISALQTDDIREKASFLNSVPIEITASLVFVQTPDMWREYQWHHRN